MITCKDNVRFKRLRPEIYNLFGGLDSVFSAMNVECVITSANDSSHSANSLHYLDAAIDLRSKHLIAGNKHLMLSRLQALCGKDYDILLENPGLENEHFHIEFDPKH